MAFKLIVKKSEREEVTRSGAQMLPDGKTWVIPDEILDINGFKPWLPKREGYIVQRPYFVLRAKCRCWKCGQETPVVVLGAMKCQELLYETRDTSSWSRQEGPVLFTEVEYMDATIRESMHEHYLFFMQRVYAWHLTR